MIQLKSRFLPHNVIYDVIYYNLDREKKATRSSLIMAASIMRDLKPMRVVDVGCGTGTLLEALCNEKCEVFGLDGAKAAITKCRSRGLNVQQFNIEKDTFTIDQTYDLVISMEVAEHLPGKVSERYID